MIIVRGQNMKKNQLIKNNRLKKKELTEKEESVDLSHMPPLQGDEEEVKEEKGLTI